MSSTFPKRRLGRSPLEVTTLGFGGGPIGWRDNTGAAADAAATLAAAWGEGVRYFDTAPFYGFGRSERRVGAFLSARPRGDFVLSTKVGRLVRDCGPAADPIVYDYSRDGAARSIEESLARLGLGGIDIALIHDIDGWTHGAHHPRRFAEALDGAYRTLADLKASGALGAVGLGVNEWRVCQAFAERVPVDCFLLAGRHTLLEQEAAETFLPFCLERGIGIIIGGPYNSGILASGAVRGATYNYRPAPEAVMERVRRIAATCDAHGVPLPAAALAFPLRHPAVACVIPGVAGPAEAEATAAFARTPIPDALWRALAAEGLVRE
jgi:D-threo-aldose 1-dehydrogenase